MADAADTTVASAGQAVLTVADLNTSVNHEPRVQDLRLAGRLGMAQERDIRKLIDRHRAALEQLGSVCATVAQTSRKGGRPGRTFWLNKRQCLYLCTKSETANATEVTIQMVEVFDEYLQGTLPAAKGVAVRGYTRAAPRRAPPQPSVRENHAIMRIAGEMVLVDLARIELGPEERAVCIDSLGALSVETVILRQDPHNPRIGIARVPRQAGQGLSRRGLQVVGAVIAILPLPAGDEDAPPPRIKPSASSVPKAVAYRRGGGIGRHGSTSRRGIMRTATMEIGSRMQPIRIRQMAPAACRMVNLASGE